MYLWPVQNATYVPNSVVIAPYNIAWTPTCPFCVPRLDRNMVMPFPRIRVYENLPQTLIRTTLGLVILAFSLQGTWGQSTSSVVVASTTVAPPVTTVYVGGEPTETEGGNHGENGENEPTGPCFDDNQPCEMYLDALEDCTRSWSQNANNLASCQCGANHIWLDSVILPSTKAPLGTPYIAILNTSPPCPLQPWFVGFVPPFPRSIIEFLDPRIQFNVSFGT